MKIFIMTLLFFLSSCANFINKIHRDLDQTENKRPRVSKSKRKRYDSFDRFRNPYYSTRKATSNNYKKMRVKRKYRPSQQIKKRYTVDDLTDNQSDGSLWSGRGNNNYLFSLDQEKKNGDIVVINVYDRLKQEIQMELKRASPKRARPKVAKSKDKKKPTDKPSEKAVADKPESTASDDAFDKISSVIIEKINKDHFLIRGQKQILFQNKKRVIEIQALVAKRDISVNDTIHSDKILESNIYLVR